MVTVQRVNFCDWDNFHPTIIHEIFPSPLPTMINIHSGGAQKLDHMETHLYTNMMQYIIIQFLTGGASHHLTIPIRENNLSPLRWTTEMHMRISPFWIFIMSSSSSKPLRRTNNGQIMWMKTPEN